MRFRFFGNRLSAASAPLGLHATLLQCVATSKRCRGKPKDSNPTKPWDLRLTKSSNFLVHGRSSPRDSTTQPGLRSDCKLSAKMRAQEIARTLRVCGRRAQVLVGMFSLGKRSRWVVAGASVNTATEDGRIALAYNAGSDSSVPSLK